MVKFFPERLDVLTESEVEVELLEGLREGYPLILQTYQYTLLQSLFAKKRSWTTIN